MTTHRHRAVDDRGFTLVELLVTMSIAVVVLLAVLQGADALRATSDASSRLTDTQESGRRTLRTITDALRQASTPDATGSPLLGAAAGSVAPDDLVVRAAVGTGAGRTPGWKRFCAAGGTLFEGRSTTGPPNGACGAPTAGWTYAALIAGRLRDTGLLFTYAGDAGAATTPAAVRTVGIRLALADRARDAAPRLVTQGAVSLRNRNPY